MSFISEQSYEYYLEETVYQRYMYQALLHLPFKGTADIATACLYLYHLSLYRIGKKGLEGDVTLENSLETTHKPFILDLNSIRLLPRR